MFLKLTRAMVSVEPIWVNFNNVETMTRNAAHPNPHTTLTLTGSDEAVLKVFESPEEIIASFETQRLLDAEPLRRIAGELERIASWLENWGPSRDPMVRK